MKQIFASILVMAKAPKVLMGMFSALFITINAAAQTQSVPAPATLTDAEVVAIKNALASNNAAAMSMTPADSSLFVSLLESNNTPIVTRVAQAGMLCGAHNEAGDSVRLYIIRTQAGFNLFNNTFFRVPERKTVEDRSAVARVDSAAIHSQFVEKQLEGKPRYRVEFQADQHDISDGKIVDKAMDKYGLSLLAGGVYQLGNGLNSFGGEAGISYSVANKTGRWFVMSELSFGFSETRYNDNANSAGEKYRALDTKASLYGGIGIGKHNDHRFSLGGGLGWQYYSTDSQTRYYEDGSWDTMSSKGNYLYPHVDFQYEWDIYNSPVSIYGGAGIFQHKSVWQNADAEEDWMWGLRLGMKIKLFRHVNSNR